MASYLFEVKPFGSVPMLLDKLAYSPLSVGLLSLVYLLAKIDSIEQLRVFLVRIGLVLDPQVLREFLDELEGAS